MTLNQLNYFYETATLLHFNEAAKRLNLSEPSLSRSISSLENELGLPLFEKKGRNVILTKAGEIFLEHVKQILGEVRRTEKKMHELATDGGHIDIAYVSPLAKTFIPHTVHSFLGLAENKNVTFHFYQDITSANIAGLKKGDYDLIFGSFTADEPEIEFIPILKQDMVVVLPPSHPLCEKKYIDADDFSNYQVLAYTRQSGLGKYTHDFFVKNRVNPNYVCESPDENGIASLAAMGFGIALVADTDDIHRDDICIRPLSPKNAFSHTVYMGYLRDNYQLPAVKRFIRFVLNRTSPPAQTE